jgi:hypothetical protein
VPFCSAEPAACGRDALRGGQNIVQLWWTYSECVGRFGVTALLAIIVFKYMALARSIAWMYVMFFLVYRPVRVSACRCVV